MGRKIWKAASVAALILSVMLVSVDVQNAEAWVYPDGSADDLFEMFGPRADNLLIELYPSAEAEWEALETGEIDITDWPLTMDYYEQFTSPPYNDTLTVVPYGAEFSFYMLDINNNNNTYLGDPNQGYTNPVYPNPCSVLGFRIALAYLINRQHIMENITKGLGMPIWTPMPPAMGVFVHPEICPGGDLENLTYGGTTGDVNVANETLSTSGFPIGYDGWRFWDRNGNGVVDPDEQFEIKLVIPFYDAYARSVGEFVAGQLEAVRVRVNKIYVYSEPEAKNRVMIFKDFHLYIGRYVTGVDPDFLITWNSRYYWHPGIPPNYNGINNTDYDYASDGVKYATTRADAIDQAYMAQVVFAENALSIPLFSASGYKAVSKRYVGQEAPYTGEYWYGVVNEPGYGIDNYWSFLDMHTEHPAEAYFGDAENSTIRWGFSTYGDIWINPIYIGNHWEKKILDLIYEPLFRRGPNYYQFYQCLADSWSIGSYLHPETQEEKMKITISLSSDIYWDDGTPITALDVYFTLVEIKEIFEEYGYPPPTWISNVENILDFKIYDPYNFEILFDNSSIWGLSWLADVPILPRHIWYPKISNGNWGRIDLSLPDSNCTGSGLWKFFKKLEGGLIWLKKKLKEAKNWLLGVAGNWLIEKINGLKTRLKKIKLEDIRKLIKEFRNNVVKEALKEAIKKILGFEPPDLGVTVYLYYKKPPMPKWELLGESSISLQNLGDVGQTAEAIASPLAQVGVGPLYCKTDVKIWAKINGSEVFTIWFNDTRKDPTIIWITILEDIVGSTFYDDIGWGNYSDKGMLPSPDIKVDMKDVGTAARAFGSFPGHARWCTTADINGDYKVDMIDVGRIARKFGWSG